MFFLFENWAVSGTVAYDTFSLKFCTSFSRSYYKSTIPNLSMVRATLIACFLLMHLSLTHASRIVEKCCFSKPSNESSQNQPNSDNIARLVEELKAAMLGSSSHSIHKKGRVNSELHEIKTTMKDDLKAKLQAEGIDIRINYHLHSYLSDHAGEHGKGLADYVALVRKIVDFSVKNVNARLKYSKKLQTFLQKNFFPGVMIIHVKVPNKVNRMRPIRLQDNLYPPQAALLDYIYNKTKRVGSAVYSFVDNFGFVLDESLTSRNKNNNHSDKKGTRDDKKYDSYLAKRFTFAMVEEDEYVMARLDFSEDCPPVVDPLGAPAAFLSSYFGDDMKDEGDPWGLYLGLHHSEKFPVILTSRDDITGKSLMHLLLSKDPDQNEMKAALTHRLMLFSGRLIDLCRDQYKSAAAFFSVLFPRGSLMRVLCPCLPEGGSIADVNCVVKEVSQKNGTVVGEHDLLFTYQYISDASSHKQNIYAVDWQRAIGDSLFMYSYVMPGYGVKPFERVATLFQFNAINDAQKARILRAAGSSDICGAKCDFQGHHRVDDKIYKDGRDDKDAWDDTNDIDAYFERAERRVTEQAAAKKRRSLDRRARKRQAKHKLKKTASIEIDMQEAQSAEKIDQHLLDHDLDTMKYGIGASQIEKTLQEQVIHDELDAKEQSLHDGSDAKEQVIHDESDAGGNVVPPELQIQKEANNEKSISKRPLKHRPKLVKVPTSFLAEEFKSNLQHQLKPLQPKSKETMLVVDGPKVEHSREFKKVDFVLENDHDNEGSVLESPERFSSPDQCPITESPANGSEKAEPKVTFSYPSNLPIQIAYTSDTYNPLLRNSPRHLFHCIPRHPEAGRLIAFSQDGHSITYTLYESNVLSKIGTALKEQIHEKHLRIEEKVVKKAIQEVLINTRIVGGAIFILCEGKKAKVGTKIFDTSGTLMRMPGGSIAKFRIYDDEQPGGPAVHLDPRLLQDAIREKTCSQ